MKKSNSELHKPPAEVLVNLKFNILNTEQSYKSEHSLSSEWPDLVLLLPLSE